MPSGTGAGALSYFKFWRNEAERRDGQIACALDAQRVGPNNGDRGGCLAQWVGQRARDAATT